MEDDDDVDQAAETQSDNAPQSIPVDQFEMADAQPRASIPVDQFEMGAEPSGGSIPVDQFEMGTGPEPEGVVGANLREFAHGVVPMAASIPYMMSGAALGTALLPGIGTAAGIAGGAIMGGIAGYVAGQAQEAVLDATGLNDKEQRAANREALGHELLPGELAPAVIGFKPGALADSLAQRVLSGGFMGTWEAGQGLITEGKVDPVAVAAAAATGAALPAANRVGERLGGVFMPRNTAGHFVPGQTPGDGVEAPAFDRETDVRQAAQSENTKTGVGTAQEQSPPNENVTGVGNQKAPNNEPSPGAGSYAKDRIARKLAEQEAPTPPYGEAVAEPEGVTRLQDGEIAPDIRAAMGDTEINVNGERRPDLEQHVQDAAASAYKPRSGEPTPEPAAVPQGNVGQPRQPQEPFVERRAMARNPEDAAIETARANREAEQAVHDRIRAGQKGEAFENLYPDPALQSGIDRLRGRGDGRVLPDLRNPEKSEAATPAVHSNGPEAQPPGEPRKPRVLEDLTRPLTDSAEPVRTPAQERGAKFQQSIKNYNSERAVKDMDGNVVSHAKDVKLANKRNNELRAAADTMEAFKERFDKDIDIKNGEQIEGLRTLAKEAVAYAKEKGWNNYVPRVGTAREATWISEVNAFANKRKRDNRQYQPAEFIKRERMLRSGNPENTQEVRSERLDQGGRAMKRGKEFEQPITDQVTGESNLGEAGGRVKGGGAGPDAQPLRPEDRQMAAKAKFAENRLRNKYERETGEQPSPEFYTSPEWTEKMVELSKGESAANQDAIKWLAEGRDKSRPDAQPLRPEDTAVIGDTHVNVPTVKTQKLREALNPDEQMFIGGKFAEGYRELAREIVAQEPNLLVHTARNDTMDDLGRHLVGQPVAGLYDPTSHSIMIRQTPGNDTLLHEAVHGTTSRRLNSNPEMAKVVRDTMDTFRGHENLKGFDYEMSNEREFLANGMSNPRFQAALAGIKVTPDVARKLDLPGQVGKNANGFQVFANMVRKILGLGENHFTALEAAIRLTDMARVAPDRTATTPTFGKRPPTNPQIDAQLQQVKNTGDELIKQAKAPWLMKLRDMDKIVRAADPLFGGPDKNPLRVIHSAVERARVKSLKYFHDDEALHKEMWDSKAADPKEFAKLESLMQKESLYQRFGDLPLNKQGFNTHGPEKPFRDSKHPELETAFNDLSPDMQNLRARLYDYAEKRHEAISDTLAGNRLAKMIGIEDPALAKRVMEGKHSAADFLRLGGDDLERYSRQQLLQEVADREKVVGPYTPMIRRGKYAVTGLYKIKDTPGVTRAVDENTREFANKADAEDFATQQPSTTKVTRVYVDKTNDKTGSPVTREVTDKSGKQAQDPAGRDLEHDVEVPFTKEDMQTNPDIEERWRATVQRGYLKMHDTKADANVHAKELLDSKQFEPDTVDRQVKRYQPHTDAVALASQFTNLEAKLKRNVVYQHMDPKAQREMLEIMSEHYLQSLTSTRTTNTKLHRNYVQGADDDLVRNMMDYSSETGSRLARLEHQPALDAALKTAKDMVGTDKSLSNAQQKIVNEIEPRLDAMKNDFFSLASGQMGPALHRLMSVSYTARLMTPGFTIRNLTQLPLMTMAEVGGRHGFGAAWREMLHTYKELGAGKTLWGGIKDTGKAMVGKLDKPTTFVEDIKSRLTDPREKELIDHLVADGSLDPDAGFQIPAFAKRGGEHTNLDWGGADEKNAAMRGVEKGIDAADKALTWVEDVSRQLPRAAETINRGHSGVIAYRLEFRKLTKEGMSADEAHQKAMRYATDVVDNTQFRYSDTNKPTWQRNPFARVAFQFKQFGKSTYEFIGRHLGNAIKDADPEVRKASLKSLGYMAVSHIMVAGALGLPWEPVRALLIGAKTAGFTSHDWDDVENAFREGLTAVGNFAGMGDKNSKKAAEAFARGLPRLLNMDFSPGLGIDNMLLFGSPRSGQDRDLDNNLMAWAAQMAGGAPGSLAVQMMHGMRDVLGGDYASGIEKLTPMKIMADVIKAEEGMRQGKKNARGRELMSPYSPTEALTKAMGIPVAREAESNARAHMVYQKGQEIKDAKSKAITEWIRAEGEAKGKAFQNAIGAGLTPKDLTTAAARERTTRARSINGMAVNKDTAPIARRLSNVYNTRED